MNGLKNLINSNLVILVPILILILIFYIVSTKAYQLIAQTSPDLFIDHLIIFTPSITITFANNIISIVIATFVAFLITNYLSTRSSQKSSVLIVLIGFPHISFCIGITYLFSSSGLFARLFSTIYGYKIPQVSSTGSLEDSLIYIICLAIREVPFLVLIGLSVWERIQANLIKRQVSVLNHSELSGLMNCVFPIWLKSMSLPILILITFSFSNFEFSSILGPQYPSMINVKIIEAWYSSNSTTMQYLDSLVIITIFIIILATFTLALLRNFLIHYIKKTRLFMRAYFNFQLLGKFLYIALVLLYLTVFILTFLISISKSWFFPEILPNSFSLFGWLYMLKSHSNIFFISILISFSISLFCLLLISFMIEYANNTNKLFKYLFILSFTILIIPQNILLIGINEYMSNSNLISNKIWFYFSLFIYVLPYTFFMLKQIHDNFNNQYMDNAYVLGISKSKSLFSIKLPLISKDLLLIFGVSFAVCFYQFLQGILVTKGEELLFNNEVLVLFNGESINTASAGSLINFIPTSVILFLIWLRYRYVKM